MKAELNINTSRVIKDLQYRLKNFNAKTTLNVGFFEESRYDNGSYVADVARYNEFGTLDIPPRPFFRKAINDNSSKWLDFLARDLAQTENIELSYNRLGEIARGDIVKSINQTNSPPNAPSTIKAKGSSKPLVDTGFLRANVTFKVVKK